MIFFCLYLEDQPATDKEIGKMKMRAKAATGKRMEPKRRLESACSPCSFRFPVLLSGFLVFSLLLCSSMFHFLFLVRIFIFVSFSRTAGAARADKESEHNPLLQDTSHAQLRTYDTHDTDTNTERNLLGDQQNLPTPDLRV